MPNRIIQLSAQLVVYDIYFRKITFLVFFIARGQGD